MGYLSEDLRSMGYSPTGEPSPVSENGTLWSNGYEIVCDDTGVVIDGNHHVADRETQDGEPVYVYHNSKKVKLFGGYIGSYDWGHDGDRFKY